MFSFSRLQIRIKIVDAAGQATTMFHRFLNDFASAIEGAVNSLAEQLILIQAAQAAAEQAALDAAAAQVTADALGLPEYLVATPSATLTNERVLVGTLGVGLSYTVPGNATASLTGQALALYNVVTAADKAIYATGAGTFSTTDLTAIARAFLAQTTQAGQRTALGLVIGTDVQAYDGDLQALTANTTNGLWARTGSGTGSARTATGTAGEITVTSGDGVGGNPTWSLPATLVFTGKTVTGGTYTSPTINTPTMTDPTANRIGIGTPITTSFAGYGSADLGGTAGGYVNFKVGTTDIGTVFGDGTGVTVGTRTTLPLLLRYNNVSSARVDDTGIRILVGGVRFLAPTLASLGSAATAGLGSRRMISDATTPAFGATAVGGGAVVAPVYSDGSAWKVG